MTLLLGDCARECCKRARASAWAYREKKEGHWSDELAPQRLRMAHEGKAHGHGYLRENCKDLSRCRGPGYRTERPRVTLMANRVQQQHHSVYHSKSYADADKNLLLARRAALPGKEWERVGKLLQGPSCDQAFGPEHAADWHLHKAVTPPWFERPAFHNG